MWKTLKGGAGAGKKLTASATLVVGSNTVKKVLCNINNFGLKSTK
jgi:hypothetical protein